MLIRFRAYAYSCLSVFVLVLMLVLFACCESRLVYEAVYVKVYFFGSRVKERAADVRCISKSSLNLNASHLICLINSSAP